MCPPALPCPPCPLPQVVFHLQTRTPAVLPPLCELFGAAPGSERPMQDHVLPEWRLLQVGSVDVWWMFWGAELPLRGHCGGLCTSGAAHHSPLLHLIARN
jgi:hypothetical protein